MQNVTSERNRIHKTLQDANVKLTSYLSDLFGASGRALLTALVENWDITPELVLAVVKGNAKKKVPELVNSLAGKVRAHHRRMIGYSLEHIDFLSG